jgi:hypothetical protein
MYNPCQIRKNELFFNGSTETVLSPVRQVNAVCIRVLAFAVLLATGTGCDTLIAQRRHDNNEEKSDRVLKRETFEVSDKVI